MGFNSSPVEKNATRRRRNTVISPMPSEAIVPSSAGCTRSPARNTTCPGLMSSPAKRRFVPSFVDRARRDDDAAVLLARALLHDDGVGALRHHAAGEDAHALARADDGVAGLAGERFADPREDRLAIRREVAEAHARSRPSPNCRGRGPRPASVTSVASTRPSDDRRWTRSVAVTGTRNVRMKARARSTGIEFGS